MPTETLRLVAADGVVLDGELDLVTDPIAAVVMLHPHPLYGGDRHNHVVQAVRRRLVADGCAVVTFDFRGVGRSGGSHDRGGAERLDAVAALEVLRARAPGVPLVVAGYSFGSLVGLSIQEPDTAAWVAVAPPLSEGNELVAALDARPKLIVSGAHDQFCPADAVLRLTSTWVATTVVEVPQADHFLNGRLAVVEDSVSAFVRTLAER